MATELTVGACRLDDVLELRHSVLRPHQRAEDVVFSGDLAPGSAHFCAIGTEGAVVSVASVHQEAPSWRPAARAWRLRAMATAPEWRGRGAGSAVLWAAMAYVREAGGGLFWCDARLVAAGFYEHAGMARTGATWEIPVLGPHVAMWTWLEASPLQAESAKASAGG